MARKFFPPLTFGIDRYHGRRGDETVQAGGAKGNGYELLYFRGRWLEKISVQTILELEAAEHEVYKNERDNEFLSQMGFTSDGSTLK